MLTDTRNKHFSERLYGASGVPMAQSSGREQQPYMYNSKEFIEAHDYNTYDYGFRGYYAPIGRFISVDPSAEQTPWQSPYTASYAMLAWLMLLILMPMTIIYLIYLIGKAIDKEDC